MGAYDDPKAVDYSQIIKAVTSGMTAWVGRTLKGLKEFEKEQKLETDKSNKIISKNASSATANIDQAYLAAKGKLDDFTAGLGTKDSTGKMTQSKDAPLFQEQIGSILTTIGKDANEEIERIQKEGGGLDEIRDVKNKAITEMNNLANDMAYWDVARKEYMKSKGKNPKQVGALLLNQSNPALIRMFDAATDKEQGNLYITKDKNGHFRVSLGKMETIDGKEEFDVYTSLDVTSWSAERADDGTFFDEVTDEPIEMKELKTTIDEEFEKGRFKDKEGKLDGAAVKDYFMNDPKGRSLMDDYLMYPTQARGQWRQLTTPSEAKELTKNNEWSYYDNSYSDDAFLGKIVDRTLTEFYADAAVVEEEADNLDLESQNNQSPVMDEQWFPSGTLKDTPKDPRAPMVREGFNRPDEIF